MSVRIARNRRGTGLEVDIRTVTPDGVRVRWRRKAPVSSVSGALRWGQAREREIALHGSALPKTKEVPTLGEYAQVFLNERRDARKNKPSYLAALETIIRVHLVPALGGKRLDAITSSDVQRLEVRLGDKSKKTANNVLSVLKSLLQNSVKSSVVREMPCSICIKRVPPDIDMPFHEDDELTRLIDTAGELGWKTHLCVLLGADAGLRAGEMMGLEWADIDLSRARLVVKRSVWRGHVSAPKGGRQRRLPLTRRLVDALSKNRHVRGPRVLVRDDGSEVSQKIVRELVSCAASNVTHAQSSPVRQPRESPALTCST